jgi:transcriptional regulator with GAF, ATPase, and Fis domain
VLSLKKTLDKNDVLSYLPKANRNSNLPVLSSKEEGSGDISDREILYKVLFDMRKDLNEMKKIVFALVQNGTVSPEVLQDDMFREVMEMQNGGAPIVGDGNAPLIINQTHAKPMYQAVEEIEESLSIADKEKELIIKALQKHRGRRKDAALDLGISERTLYRKIKEYEINE